MNNEKILDISWQTLLKIGLAILAFYLLYAIRDILLWVVFALVISVLFNPAINFLHRRRIPRVLSVICVYLIVFGLMSLFTYLVVPLFAHEIQQFLRAFPDYFERLSPILQQLGVQTFENVEGLIESFGGTLEAMAANIFNALFAFFGGVFSTLFIVTTAFFLSLEGKIMEKVLIMLFPKKYEAAALHIWERSQKKVIGWFGARLLASLFVGVASYITFFVFDIRYPFTLALLAAVFNFIPYIGPLVMGVLLFVLVFPIDILKALFVLIAFTLIQQIDGSILSPILMKRITGLPPVLVLIALVVGAKLWGVLGALLVVPLAGIIFEFLKEFLYKRKEREAVVL